MKNPYESLGISKTASTDEIKTAYRKLAKKYHPDLNPNDKVAEEKMKEINAAYEVLGDEKKRANYDRFGSSEGAGTGFGGGGFGGGMGGFDFSSMGGFSDIFEGIFGGAGGGFSGMGGSYSEARTRKRAVQGGDVRISMNLTFEESCLGVKKKVTFSRFEKCTDCGGTGAKGGSNYTTCDYCKGQGRVRQQQRLGGFGIIENVVPCTACNATGRIIKEKCTPCGGKGVIKRQIDFEVNVPAGISDGQTLNISAEGDAPLGVAEGISGNLLISIRVTPHPLLVRDEFDLYLELPISFTQAMLGDKIQIPTIEGTSLLTIHEGTQSGTIHRLKGKGVKRLRGIGSGDLIVKIIVEVPKRLDRKQTDMLRVLDQTISPSEYYKRKIYKEKMEKL